jgi:hypothetical protein
MNIGQSHNMKVGMPSQQQLMNLPQVYEQAILSQIQKASSNTHEDNYGMLGQKKPKNQVGENFK